MSQAPIFRLRQKLDDWRVRQHFKRVEATLRNRDVNHLSPSVRLARDRYLDWLHNYAVSGVFPRNHERPGYAPCFIDRDGRECAVAHLMMSSGYVELAHNIAALDNYAYIPHVALPELDDWAAKAGLSREELTLIQPGYYLTLTDSLLSMAVAAWATGLMTVLINAIQMARRRRGIVIPIVSLGVAIVLLLVGYICLDSALYAYDLGTNPDGYPYNLPLRDVGPLALGVVISVGLALLTGWLCFYRIRDFFSFARKNPEHDDHDIAPLP